MTLLPLQHHIVLFSIIRQNMIFLLKERLSTSKSLNSEAGGVDCVSVLSGMAIFTFSFHVLQGEFLPSATSFSTIFLFATVVHLARVMRESTSSLWCHSAYIFCRGTA